MAILEVRNLTKTFGGLCAIDKLDLKVLDSEILGVIGPNGAGKSTMLNIISGFITPSSGEVIVAGEKISGLRPDEIAIRTKVGRIFQASTIFTGLTVFDNVFTGFHMHYAQPAWKAFLHGRGSRREESGLRRRTIEILEFMGLASLKDELAENLPHGHQRILAVSVALATNPRLLLLDEPLTGMNATEIGTMINLIRQIRESDIAIVLVEHNVKAVMESSDRIVVLNYGRKIAEGLPEEIRANKDVIEAYLGKEEEQL